MSVVGVNDIRALTEAKPDPEIGDY